MCFPGIALRVRVQFALVVLLLLFLPGCAAGVVGAIVAIVAGSDDGDGDVAASTVDALPTVAFVGDPRFHENSPEVIEVRYRLRNDDDGELGAKVEVEELQTDADAQLITDGGGNPLPAGGRQRAAPFGGFTSTAGGLPRDAELTFLWDVRANLGADAGMARFVITPIEDGAEGVPEATVPFRIGNTGVRVEGLQLSSNQGVLTVLFRLADREEDQVAVNDRTALVELSVDGGSFEKVPLALIEAPPIFSSSRSGLAAFFNLDLKKFRDSPLAPAALRLLGEPGLRADLTLRVSLRDFAEEPFSPGEAGLLFDNNEAPLVEILSLDAGSPPSGVVAIRYRLLDPDLNPATLVVEVDRGDGDGFSPANEFPVPPSEGTEDLCSTDPRDPEGNAGCREPGRGPVHTFLWDARSQADFRERITIRLRARDRESGPANSRDLAPFDLRGLTAAGETLLRPLRCGDPDTCEEFVLAGADFNDDGFTDLVVTERDHLGAWFRGTSFGLVEAAAIPARGGAVATGDFNGDGYPDLAVADRNTDQVSYLEGSFSGLVPAGELPVGAFPVALAAADFDGDGFTDLAVASGSADEVSYLRGTKDGLVAAGALPTGSSPGALVAGDADGDGFPDLAAANQFSDNLTHYRGTAAGLERRGEIALGDSPVDLAAGDFDGDGFTDFAAANQVSLDVSYLRGSGEGPVRASEIELGGPPNPLTAGDFDGDGFPDLLAGESWLRGSEEGLIREGDLAGLGRVLTTGDFDGDGILDLVSGRKGTEVDYFRGTAGGPVWAGEIAVGSGPNGLATGDFNGDRFPDVAVVNQFSDSISFLRGTGGQLVRVDDLSVGENPLALSAGDFDGDGFPDVAVANSSSDNISFLRGTVEGSLVRAEDIPVGDSPAAFASGDYDADGVLDLAVANAASDSVSWLRKTAAPEGGLAAAREIPVGDSPAALASGDYDRDGVVDLAVANRDSGNLTWLRGSGSGLAPAGELTVGDGPTALLVADFDADGFPDLAVANASSGDVTWLRGTAGGLVRVGEIPAGSAPSVLSSGDYDGDGFLDLAVGNTGEESLSTLRGTGRGLERGGEIAVGESPIALSTADYDGDGLADLALALAFLDEGSSFRYLRGTPGGLEKAGEVFDVGSTLFSGALSIHGGDLDGDGFPDVAVAGGSSDYLSYFRGTSAGFVRAGRIPVGVGQRAIASGDFNGDGFADLVVMSQLSGNVTLLRHRWLQVHLNVPFDPESPEDFPRPLLDPRNPPRWLLDLPPAPFLKTTPVCAIPGAPFDLPQGEASGRGRYLLNLTDPVALLPEDSLIRGPATLTLRLRDHDRALLDRVVREPERLVVFRRNSATGRGEAAARGGDLRLVSLRGDLAVTFSVSRFGTYTAAFELDR